MSTSKAIILAAHVTHADFWGGKKVLLSRSRVWHPLKAENKSKSFKNVEKPKTKAAWPWSTVLCLQLSKIRKPWTVVAASVRAEMCFLYIRTTFKKILRPSEWVTVQHQENILPSCVILPQTQNVRTAIYTRTDVGLKFVRLWMWLIKID